MDFSDMPSCSYGNIPAALINQYYHHVYQENYLFARADLYHRHQYASGFSQLPPFNQWAQPFHYNNVGNYYTNGPHHREPALEEAPNSETNSTHGTETCESDFSSTSPTNSTPDSTSPQLQKQQQNQQNEDLHFPKLEIDLDRSQQDADSVHEGQQTSETTTPGPTSHPNQNMKLVKKVIDGRKKRAAFNQQQVSILESYFEISHYPSEDYKYKLSDSTGLTVNQVRNWFQNRRSKEKRRVKLENDELPKNENAVSSNIQEFQERQNITYPTLRDLLSATPGSCQKCSKNLCP